ncbi:hypothetical protein C8J57DRAFT_1313423 [Mycena rebaudengoi]|nr:hypothetical protein C8J57DRAFT_1313423 [Mycena rebaudengoi]
MAPAPPSALPPLPPNIGSMSVQISLIGSLLNFYLFGVLSVQVLYLIFFLMTLSTCLNAADVYFWYAAGFGNIIPIFTSPYFSPFFYTPILGSVIALMIQLFFVYRIRLIAGKSLPITCINIGIAFVAVIQAAGGIGGGIKAYVTANTEHDVARTVLVYLWLIGDAVADVAIAVVMTVLPVQSSRQTNDVVKRIVRLIMETNALSAGVAILGLVLFAGVPGTNYFVCPTLILPGIYANTLLITFNNRAFSSSGGLNRTQQTPSFADTYQAPRQTGGPTGGPMTFTDPEDISLKRLESDSLDKGPRSEWHDPCRFLSSLLTSTWGRIFNLQAFFYI